MSFEKSISLAEALPVEIDRNEELLEDYRSLGPVGEFGARMIQMNIDAAKEATLSGDTVAMLRAFEILRRNK